MKYGKLGDILPSAKADEAFDAEGLTEERYPKKIDLKVELAPGRCLTEDFVQQH